MTKHYVRHLWTLLLPLLLAAHGGVAADDALPANTAPPQVEVNLHDVDGFATFDVTASLIVNADQARSWSVLTDYDRMAQFVPNLKDSRVVARQGDISIVTQHWVAKFLFLRQSITLRLQVTEQENSAIEIRRISGNMHTYQTHWELQPLADGTTKISYGGIIAPDFYVPALFGSALMKGDLRNMLEAVRSEIEKH